MNIIITGATKGIGYSVAKLFAAKGFSMCICARTSSDLETVRKELLAIQTGIEVHIMPVDLSQKKSVEEFAAFCKSKFSDIDVLMNNAGIFKPGNIYDEPDGNLDYLMDINLHSAYYLTRLLVPGMIENRKGHIYTMCSVASINAYDAGGSYAISKFALLGFAKNLRHELKQFNIRVTNIIAGAALTDSWKGTELPDNRFMDPDDVAKMIWSAYDVSERTVVEEILLRPMLGDI